MITLKQITYSLAVQKTLHFKKAAELCFISPSNLSNAINEMELQLGFQVFERTNKQVMITASGCLLYTSPSPRDGTKSRMPSSA